MDRNWILVSDLDGTLLGDDRALAELAEWIGARRDRFRIVYASGRFLDSIRADVWETDLPQPDAIVGGVGTEIHGYPDGRPVVGWPHLRGRWESERVRACLSPLRRLTLQPDEFQSRYKVSYFLEDAMEEELAAIADRLERADLDADVLYSSSLHLDILPAGVHKGSAVNALIELWGIAADRILVCGDSGNDLPLFELGGRGIIVANARAELKRLCADHVYHAKEPFAAGVLEGLKYWMAAVLDERDR